MNAITLKSEKQLDKPKATQGEECKGVVKEVGKSLMEEEVDLAPKDKGQGKVLSATSPFPSMICKG